MLLKNGTGKKRTFSFYISLNFFKQVEWIIFDLFFSEIKYRYQIAGSDDNVVIYPL